MTNDVGICRLCITDSPALKIHLLCTWHVQGKTRALLQHALKPQIGQNRDAPWTFWCWGFAEQTPYSGHNILATLSFWEVIVVTSMSLYFVTNSFPSFFFSLHTAKNKATNGFVVQSRRRVGSPWCCARKYILVKSVSPLRSAAPTRRNALLILSSIWKGPSFCEHNNIL